MNSAIDMCKVPVTVSILFVYDQVYSFLIFLRITYSLIIVGYLTIMLKLNIGGVVCCRCGLVYLHMTSTMVRPPVTHRVTEPQNPRSNTLSS